MLERRLSQQLLQWVAVFIGAVEVVLDFGEEMFVLDHLLLADELQYLVHRQQDVERSDRHHNVGDNLSLAPQLVVEDHFAESIRLANLSEILA